VNNTNHLPHSQCSLRENHKFLQNFRPKNFEKIFDQNYGFISDLVIQAWHSKVKNYYITSQTVCISKTYVKNASELCE
jgi:hypothetical protein